MTIAVVLGAVLALGGLVLVVTGIRGGPDARPRNMAMLIGGMMMAAFGVIITGFSLLYQHDVSSALNAGAGQ